MVSTQIAEEGKWRDKHATKETVTDRQDKQLKQANTGIQRLPITILFRSSSSDDLVSYEQHIVIALEGSTKLIHLCAFLKGFFLCYLPEAKKITWAFFTDLNIFTIFFFL